LSGHNRIELVMEGVVLEQLLESRQLNFEGLLKWLAGPRLEVEVRHIGCALSDTTERVSPLQLLGHLDDDGGTALCHRLG